MHCTLGDGASAVMRARDGLGWMQDFFIVNHCLHQTNIQLFLKNANTIRLNSQPCHSSLLELLEIHF